MGAPLNRTAFLIDGFNLYHSLKDAGRDLGGVSTRWLDLRALCSSFLYQVGGNAQLAGIFYFSALARHLEATKPQVTQRHLAYLECLRSTGVEVELAQFKEKWIACPFCHASITRHEEKETDVAIAVKFMELSWRDQCDSIVVVSGDSALAPAFRAVQRHFPQKGLYCCFPYRRGSFELQSLAKGSFRIRKERYAKHQLPDPVVLAGGRRISKPVGW